MLNEIVMVKCHDCIYEDDIGAFHDIDNMLICDDCYEKQRPYQCIDCKYESYDSTLFRENKNEDDECIYCICHY